MIPGLLLLLVFQGLGEVVSRALALPIPGPVAGLLLLLAWFRLRGRVEPTTEAVALAFSQHLGLLFVPAAVGVVVFWPQLASNAVPVAVALVTSVIATIAATALVLRLLVREPR